jgi:hypothetical protein
MRLETLALCAAVFDALALAGCAVLDALLPELVWARTPP